MDIVPLRQNNLNLGKPRQRLEPGHGRDSHHSPFGGLARATTAHSDLSYWSSRDCSSRPWHSRPSLHAFLLPTTAILSGHGTSRRVIAPPSFLHGACPSRKLRIIIEGPAMRCQSDIMHFQMMGPSGHLFGAPVCDLPDSYIPRRPGHSRFQTRRRPLAQHVGY